MMEFGSSSSNVVPRSYNEQCEDSLAKAPYPGQVIAAAMDESNDPAAVFACALSLHTACLKAVDSDPSVNLSEAYQGGDQFMREMMRVADLFETWACEHVAFEALKDVWPYLLEDRFGDACLALMAPGDFAGFDRDDCLRVAFRLKLPVWTDCGVPVPVFIERAHPVSTSAFRFLRIRTVRDSLVENGVASFCEEDDPFDENFGEPYFGIYGLDEYGTVEHIADRDNYAAARELIENLVPGSGFPKRVVGFRTEEITSVTGAD
jgi:hypothetical protein